MQNHLRNIGIGVIFILLAQSILAQSIGYEENKGQWDDAVVARYRLGNGVAWFMKDRVRLPLVEGEHLLEAMEFAHDNPEADNIVNGHAYEIVFGSTAETAIQKNGRHSDYVNYFIGRKRSKWATRVGIFDELVYQEIKEGVNILWSIDESNMKYTLELAPGVDPQSVYLEYGAVRAMEVKDQALRITLPNLEVFERAPYAFQLIDGAEQPVDVAFDLKGKQLYFEVGDYDQNLPLFIDPTLVASTNVGATVSTYGHSATYDQFGNIYGGGRPFGLGYPTDTGSFQVNFGGGGVDIGLSKLNEDGSDLLWSTYIGGSGPEYVHSIVVNGFNDVVVYGKTTSADYPVSATAVDTVLGNGASNFNDICVTVLSDSGDQLIGSTYLGGAGADGDNAIGGFGYSNFKGEVDCDLFSNVYIASTTSSDDINITAGAYQDTLMGGQDAYVAKLNFDLSQLLFATYLGTDQNDGAFNVEAAEDGTVYVVGITGGDDFPVTMNAEDTNYNGGQVDGFVSRLSSNGTQLMASSYIRADTALALNERALFLQIDRDGAVYVMGNMDEGSIVADTNRYAGPGQNQSFIRKYTPQLDSIHWTATFTPVSHSAFLVDNCKNIYVAGNGVSATNVELTANAVMSTQAGFYIMLLNEEADSLVHGTFYGNGGSHVDGGTSRFDRRGAVYQATCSAGSFPLNNNAWSGNQNNGTYDLTLFKIDFDIDAAYANIQVSGTEPVGCVPHTVNFTNVGSEGLIHAWDFGDGDTASIPNPTHTFTTPGVYEVKYVITDTAGCILEDSATLLITVYDTAAINILSDSIVCEQEVELTTDSPFSVYNWSNGSTSPSITVNTSGTYWVELTNECGTFSDTIALQFATPFDVILPNDTGICEPGLVLNGPNGATSYNWSTGATTQSITVMNTGTYILQASNEFCDDADTIDVQVSFPAFTGGDTAVCDDFLQLTVNSGGFPTIWSTGQQTDTIIVVTSGTYWVAVQNDYCVSSDTIEVNMDPLQIALGPDAVFCAPTSIDATTPFAETYLWSTGDTTASILISQTGDYWVIASNNACSDTDTVNIDIQILKFIDQQELLCDLDTYTLIGPGPVDADYFWSTGDTTRNIIISESDRYTVTVSTPFCFGVDTLDMRFVTTPKIDVGEEYTICDGQEAEVAIDLDFPGVRWSNGDTGRVLSVTDSGSYVASFSYEGCEVLDTVHVRFARMWPDSIFEIGNVITPNGDGLNDQLSLEFKRRDLVTDYDLVVYNRWGNEVFRAAFINHYWDGRMPSGEPAENGVYFYQIDAKTVCTDVPLIKIQDHVTLFR